MRDAINATRARTWWVSHVHAIRGIMPRKAAVDARDARAVEQYGITSKDRRTNRDSTGDPAFTAGTTAGKTRRV